MVDPKDAARRLKLMNARERVELDRRRALARAEGSRLARRILAEIPGVGTVRGFGSTWDLWRDYRRDSDIDLALEGGDILSAMAIVEQSSIPVDVLDLSSCPSSMAHAIRQNGVILATIAGSEGTP